jgi:hypothetical protein
VELRGSCTNGMALRGALLSLFSLVTLFAHRQMAQEGSRTIRRAAWYDKSRPTFTDALALVRKELWSCTTFRGSLSESDTVKVPRAFKDRQRRRFAMQPNGQRPAEGGSRKSLQISANSQSILSPLSHIAVSYLSYKSSTGYGEGDHIGAGTE